MEKDIFRIVDQAIVNGQAEEAMCVLRAAQVRIRRSSNASYTAVHHFYRDHAHKLTIDERKWFGKIMAAASRGFVRDEDARIANEIAARIGEPYFL